MNKGLRLMWMDVVIIKVNNLKRGVKFGKWNSTSTSPPLDKSKGPGYSPESWGRVLSQTVSESEMLKKRQAVLHTFCICLIKCTKIKII